MGQVDNFLTTDKEAYNTMSESDVDYDDVGTLPQYSVFDASFLSEGDFSYTFCLLLRLKLSSERSY